MAWLNDLFLKYRTILADGFPMPRRKNTNFVGGTITDDPANDATTVAFSGGGGSGQITVASLAAIVGISTAALSSGARAYVSPGFPRAWFKLNKELTRDPVEGVYYATDLGTGTWEREAISDPDDLAYTNWEINDDDGLVDNSGEPDSPIPGAEWERRTCNPIYKPTVPAVNILVSGAATVLPGGFIDPTGSVISFEGAPISTGISGTVADVVVGDIATNQLWTAQLVGMTAYINADHSPLILITSGANAGNGMWHAPNGSEMSANEIPLNQPSAWDAYAFGGTEEIVNGDPWEAFELPILDITNLKILGAIGIDGPAGTGFVTFEKIHVRGVQSGSFVGYFGQIGGFGIAYAYALHCFFDTLSASILLQTVGCKFDLIVPQSALAGLTGYASLFVGGGMYLANAATCFLHSGPVIAGTSLFLANGTNLNWRGGFAVNCIYAAPFITQDAAVLRFDGHAIGGDDGNVAPLLQLGAGTQVLGLDGDLVYAATSAEVPIHIEDDWVFNPVNVITGLLDTQVDATFGALVGGDIGAVNLKHDVHFAPSPTGP